MMKNLQSSAFLKILAPSPSFISNIYWKADAIKINVGTAGLITC